MQQADFGTAHECKEGLLEVERTQVAALFCEEELLSILPNLLFHVSSENRLSCDHPLELGIQIVCEMTSVCLFPQAVLYVLLLTAGMVLAKREPACPLAFSESLLESTMGACENSCGQGECCFALTNVIVQAQALRANTTGKLSMDSATATACFDKMNATLLSWGVGEQDFLTACSITEMDLAGESCWADVKELEATLRPSAREGMFSVCSNFSRNTSSFPGSTTDKNAACQGCYLALETAVSLAVPARAPACISSLVAYVGSRYPQRLSELVTCSSVSTLSESLNTGGDYPIPINRANWTLLSEQCGVQDTSSCMALGGGAQSVCKACSYAMFREIARLAALVSGRQKFTFPSLLVQYVAPMLAGMVLYAPLDNAVGLQSVSLTCAISSSPSAVGGNATCPVAVLGELGAQDYLMSKCAGQTPENACNRCIPALLEVLFYSPALDISDAAMLQACANVVDTFIAGIPAALRPNLVPCFPAVAPVTTARRLPGIDAMLNRVLPSLFGVSALGFADSSPALPPGASATKAAAPRGSAHGLMLMLSVLSGGYLALL
eukprot:jgi/Mesen1/4932/ME000246S04153